jgi:hypothetical protein
MNERPVASTRKQKKTYRTVPTLPLEIVLSEIFRPTIAMNDPAPKMLFGLVDDPDGQQERGKEVAVVLTSKRPLKRARAKAMRAKVLPQVRWL